MNDAVESNLKGHVRSVITERGEGDSHCREEHAFDRNGRLLRVSSQNSRGESSRDVVYGPDGEPLNPQSRSILNSDGSRVVIDSISGVDEWSMRYLHQCAFSTHGATVAETQYDPRKSPLTTIFRDPHGIELSTIRYQCDISGRIVNATQLDGSVEKARCSFEYDESGRLVRLETYVSGNRAVAMEMTRNARGDIVGVLADGQIMRSEYEYDERGNWIRKTNHHSGGSEEERRRITYYNE